MDRHRKLQCERLEPRELLTILADMFVDGGRSLSRVSLQREAAYLGWTTETLLTTSTLKTRAGIQGLLDSEGDPQYPVLFVNGGKAVSHGKALGAAGRQTIVDFVLGGGSVLGSCAGAYLFADYSKNVLGMWQGWMGSNGRGTHSVSFAKTPDHPIAQFLVAAGIEDMTIRNIPHIGGPRYNPNARHPEGTVFVGEIISSSRSIRRTVGTPYLIEYQPTPESGVLLLQPSHPEYGKGPKINGVSTHTILNAALLNYARLRSQVGANISSGASATNSDDWITVPAAEGEADWITVAAATIDPPTITAD
jgi:hypothetical protein